MVLCLQLSELGIESQGGPGGKDGPRLRDGLHSELHLEACQLGS